MAEGKTASKNIAPSARPHFPCGAVRTWTRTRASYSAGTGSQGNLRDSTEFMGGLNCGTILCLLMRRDAILHKPVLTSCMQSRSDALLHPSRHARQPIRNIVWNDGMNELAVERRDNEMTECPEYYTTEWVIRPQVLSYQESTVDHTSGIILHITLAPPTMQILFPLRSV